MKNAIKHIYQQPFIFATGMAALIHSTWALGTLFSGIAPEVALNWQYISWIVPAFLIAFALDVGQISTSGQIRDNGLTIARGLTFVIFAFATYYLQWLYMAVHMPLLPISAGVTGVHYDIAIMLRNVGIWLVPALLPISTIAYTFSSDDTEQEAIAPDYEKEKREYTEDDYEDSYVDHEINIITLDDTSDTLPFAGDDLSEKHSAECEFCGRILGTEYKTESNASKAITMHQKSCEAYQVALDSAFDSELYQPGYEVKS